MEVLRAQILATLAYYEALGEVALTPLEIRRYLVSPSQALKFARKKKCSADVPQGTDNKKLIRIIRALKTLTYEGRIRQECGYFSLAQGKSTYRSRIERRKIGIAKWRIAKKFGRIFSFIPYVRCAAVTGSLAVDNAEWASDIDVLIIAAPHRIWTTRFFVSAVTHLLGKRRHGSLIENRICLNHYMAQHDLTLEPKLLPMAQICATLLPLWNQNAYEMFFERNRWVQSFIPGHIGAQTSTHLAMGRGGGAASDAVESILEATGIGGMAERLLKTLQMRRIESKVRGKKLQPLEFAATDAMLLFHYPFSRSKHAYETSQKILHALKN